MTFLCSITLIEPPARELEEFSISLDYLPPVGSIVKFTRESKIFECDVTFMRIDHDSRTADITLEVLS